MDNIIVIRAQRSIKEPEWNSNSWCFLFLDLAFLSRPCQLSLSSCLFIWSKSHRLRLNSISSFYHLSWVLSYSKDTVYYCSSPQFHFWTPRCMWPCFQLLLSLQVSKRRVCIFSWYSLGRLLGTPNLQSSHFPVCVPCQTEIPSLSFLPSFHVLVGLCSVWGHSKQVNIIVGSWGLQLNTGENTGWQTITKWDAIWRNRKWQAISAGLFVRADSLLPKYLNWTLEDEK